MKSFQSTIEDNPEDNTWGPHFYVPNDVVEFYLNKKVTRFICQLNDLVEFNCAFIPSSRGKYINVNKIIRKQLNLKLGSLVTVVLKEDDSEYGMPVPQEIVDLFAHDDEFNEVFHLLTPGKQRSLLYIVGKPKNQETRIKKAIVICEHLKRRNGQLDFKILNQDFKEYNQLNKNG